MGGLYKWQRLAPNIKAILQFILKRVKVTRHIRLQQHRLLMPVCTPASEEEMSDIWNMIKMKVCHLKFQGSVDFK